MAWQISFSEKALKSLKKMNPHDAKQLVDYLKKKVAPKENPRELGRQLKFNLSDFWRYRVGKWRIICEILDDELVILVIDAGPRANIYN